MNLNKDQVNLLFEWLEKNWGKDPKCPHCGGTDWTATSKIFELSQFLSKGPNENKVFPVIPVICTKCGYTAFVNPVIAKIIPQEGAANEKA